MWFIGFQKGPKSLDLKEVPYSLDSKEVVERSKKHMNQELQKYASKEEYILTTQVNFI